MLLAMFTLRAVLCRSFNTIVMTHTYIRIPIHIYTHTGHIHTNLIPHVHQHAGALATLTPFQAVYAVSPAPNE